MIAKVLSLYPFAAVTPSSAAACTSAPTTVSPPLCEDYTQYRVVDLRRMVISAVVSDGMT